MKEVPSKEITKNTAFKDYKEADKIIRYLISPLDSGIELTEEEKYRLDICKKIHGYRCQYSSRRDVVNMILKIEGVKQTQAYYWLKQTEEIFGKIEGVHKEYERNFLLEKSRENIKLAEKSKKTEALTKAMLAHYKLCGLEEFMPDMPDFSKLEQHKYVINMPTNMLDAIKHALATGAVNMRDLMPEPDINKLSITDAEEVKDGDQ